MRKEVFLVCVILLSLLVVSPLAIAQPPFEQAILFDTGYEIQIPFIGVLEQNQDFAFHFHVFNISDGTPITNASTICSYHLYDNQGEHLVEENFIFYNSTEEINEWHILIDGNNFSRIGDYAYYVQCNSTALGGFESVEIQVTKTGFVLSTSGSITYLLLTLGSILLFLLCLYGGIVLPFRNPRGDEGTIISVQKLKYFKVGLLFLSYVFFVWVLNLFLTLSTNFSALAQYTKLFEVVFSVMNSMSYPILVFMLILMSILAWKDLELKKLLTRGISPN